MSERLKPQRQDSLTDQMNTVAMFLQNQDLLQDDILVGKVYRILSFDKCMDIAKELLSRFRIPKEIVWPEKSKHQWNPSGIESDRMYAQEEGWDLCLDACKAAVEKAKEK